jgi:bacterioferritin-associated ferredoxin
MKLSLSRISGQQLFDECHAVLDQLPYDSGLSAALLDSRIDAGLPRDRSEDERATMELDDELCLCFHVTKRKVVNFIRIEKPRRVGQLAECFGAGTGCGWCRPFLQRLFDAGQNGDTAELPSTSEYAGQRGEYIADGKGTPPGAAGGGISH